MVSKGEWAKGEWAKGECAKTLKGLATPSSGEPQVVCPVGDSVVSSRR